MKESLNKATYTVSVIMTSQLNNRKTDPDDPLVKNRPTINPYIESYRSVRNRFLWDLRPEAWHSRRKLTEWKDRYPGQKAVILCNGPSLLKSDLSLLDEIFCFGLNKINLLFERSSFRPQCVVAVNPFVIEQNADFYNQTLLPLFLDAWALRHGHVEPRRNVSFMHSMHSSSGAFARDCSVSIFQGYTVTYVAMQLAFHMGFRDVALIGADHSFGINGPANKTVDSGKTDESHFDPRYFAGGVKWQLPDLFESEVSYMRAKKVFEAFGGRIVNSTEGGCLEVFERQELAVFLQD